MSTESGRVLTGVAMGEFDGEDESWEVREVKKFGNGWSASCSVSDGDGGGTSSSRNTRASDLKTIPRLFPFALASILFPTSMQQ